MATSPRASDVSLALASVPEDIAANRRSGARSAQGRDVLMGRRTASGGPMANFAPNPKIQGSARSGAGGRCEEARHLSRSGEAVCPDCEDSLSTRGRARRYDLSYGESSRSAEDDDGRGLRQWRLQFDREVQAARLD